MAISVDWPVKIINVPKADMALIQSTPIEVRELNLNTFRLALLDLQDNDEGMPWPDTHRHNLPVDVGGITLARVVEIINDYTVTFEDGAYIVNLVGANSNVADRVNPNNVSIRSANSAGLLQSREIEQAAFQDRVAIDVVAGSAGTLYPIGTPTNPVNNLDDALLIASVRGFSTLYVVGSLTIGSGKDVSGFLLQGGGATLNVAKTTLTFESGCVTSNTEIEDCRVEGVLGGEVRYTECIIGSVSNSHCHFSGCGLIGPIQLPTSTGFDTHTKDLHECYTGINELVWDINGNKLDTIWTDFTGKVRFINGTSGLGKNYIEAHGATVTIDASCTGADEFTISGNCIVVNNSVNAVVDASLVTLSEGTSVAGIATAVWAEAIEGLTAEEMMRVMLAALAGKRTGLGTATEFYMAQDGTTPRITFSPDQNGNGDPVIDGSP